MGTIWKYVFLAAIAATITGLIVWQRQPTCPFRADIDTQVEAKPAVSAPFGGEDDVAFAEDLWDVLLASDYTAWPMRSEISIGGSPHGAYVRLYYNTVHVGSDDDHYHVIVKDNFGGPENPTLDEVTADPEAYLGAITVMVQREPGYDSDNDDWYWVKYLADGSLDVNANGVALAGRVAKGAETGCIACHTSAGRGDYLFTNDG